MILFLIAAFFAPQIPTMLLPDGYGAWTVQVTHSGGFFSTPDRDFSLSSEGKIVCGTDLRCPKDFRPPEFQPLIEMIQATLPVSSVAGVSFCSDCIRRSITIRRRDSMGIVQAYTATWDETTRSQVPKEVLRVYDAIRTLMK